jgi:mannose-6-phosphate isomerase-like protein (cupin superfamily)
MAPQHAGASLEGVSHPDRQVDMTTQTAPAAGKDEWLTVTPGERFKIRASSADTGGASLVLDVIAEPRNGVPMHVHDNEEEHFIVIEGTAHMANGDERLDAPAGTAVTVKRGVPHAWCNLTDAPLRMLVIFTPGHIEGLFLATADGADFDLATLPARYGTRIVGPGLRDDLYTLMSPRS